MTRPSAALRVGAVPVPRGLVQEYRVGRAALYGHKIIGIKHDSVTPKLYVAILIGRAPFGGTIRNIRVQGDRIELLGVPITLHLGGSILPDPRLGSESGNDWSHYAYAVFEFDELDRRHASRDPTKISFDVELPVRPRRKAKP